MGPHIPDSWSLQQSCEAAWPGRSLALTQHVVIDRWDYMLSIAKLGIRIRLGLEAKLYSRGKPNYMSFVTGFAMYDVLFWSFIGIHGSL
jgi:hypothetical protein